MALFWLQPAFLRGSVLAFWLRPGGAWFVVLYSYYLIIPILGKFMKMQKFYALALSSFKSGAANLVVCIVILAGLILPNGNLNAQAVALFTDPSGGLQWKDQVTIEQVIQQELTETNASLTMPNLTDWSSAMLAAYRSLLTYTQAQLQENHDIQDVLDKAYVLMQMEPVQQPASRAMVLDDMKAKQVELAQKLSFQ